MRLSALKMPIAHRGLENDTPWELGRFSTPPTGADRWECLGSGNGAGEWWVRALKKKRVRAPWNTLHDFENVHNEGARRLQQGEHPSAVVPSGGD